jgi:dUTPase
MVVGSVYQARVELVERLNETLRSGGGFGSTGVK